MHSISSDTVLPSDSISQAPPPHYRSQRHRDHHRSDFHSRHSSSSRCCDCDPRSGLTEANMRALNSPPVLRRMPPQQPRLWQATRKFEVVANDYAEHVYYDDGYAEGMPPEQRLPHRSSPERHSHHSRHSRHSIGGSSQSGGGHSRPSSTHRDRRGGEKETSRELVTAHPGQTQEYRRDRSPQKWVIVEVDEYDDRVVEREYTIERVRKYHYN